MTGASRSTGGELGVLAGVAPARLDARAAASSKTPSAEEGPAPSFAALLAAQPAAADLQAQTGVPKPGTSSTGCRDASDGDSDPDTRTRRALLGAMLSPYAGPFVPVAAAPPASTFAVAGSPRSGEHPVSSETFAIADAPSPEADDHAFAQSRNVAPLPSSSGPEPLCSDATKATPSSQPSQEAHPLAPHVGTGSAAPPLPISLSGQTLPGQTLDRVDPGARGLIAMPEGPRVFETKRIQSEARSLPPDHNGDADGAPATRAGRPRGPGQTSPDGKPADLPHLKVFSPAPDATPLASRAAVDPGVAGTDKGLTSVSAPPGTSQPVNAEAASRLRDALASVGHRAVLRGAASGEIELPELGRITVHARSTAAGVDIEVIAARGDARETLRTHSGEMTTDLQHANVRVARLAVEASDSPRSGDPPNAGPAPASSNASFGADGRSSASGDGRQGRTRDDAEPAPHDQPKTQLEVGRVRIVL